jgi:hypothetical protein
LFYSFIAITGFILVKYIAIPVTRLYRFGKIISHEEASLIIGKHFSSIQDKLLNVLQLQSLQHQHPQANVNYELLDASINQKTAELRPIPFTAAVDFSENKKYFKFALIPISIIVLVLFAAPSVITDSTKRLVKHSEYFEKEAPFQFVITNSDLKTNTQEDFELKVKLTGNEVPENVYIEIEGNEYRLSKEDVITFNYIFKNVQKSTLFELTADGFKSKEYELVALPNPTLLDFDIAFSYPGYLHKKDEIIKNTGDLTVPAGTKLTWTFNTENTKLLRLNFNDTSFAVQNASENSFVYSSRFFRSKIYSVATANQFLKSKDSVTYSINVIPDAYPQIEVEEKKDSFSTKQLYFRGAIKDDYGFSKLTFNYRFMPAVRLAKDLIADIMATMTARRIRHLPVVEEGRLLGVISIGDVVKYRLDEAAHEVDSLREYVMTAH